MSDLSKKALLHSKLKDKPHPLEIGSKKIPRIEGNMQTVLLTYESIPELGLCVTKELEVIHTSSPSVPDSATTSPHYYKITTNCTRTDLRGEPAL